MSDQEYILAVKESQEIIARMLRFFADMEEIHNQLEVSYANDSSSIDHD